MNNFLKYYHTVRHLKFIQIYNRIRRKLFLKPNSKKISRKIRLKKGDIINPFKKPIHKPSKMSAKNYFRALHREQEISSPSIWNHPQLEKLWLYHLHYFDELNSLNSSLNLSEQQQFLHRWINENPIGFGCGWEPYPLSLRIVNIIKWLLQYDVTDQKILSSISIQIRYLTKNIEYHLLANHLLANAKALIFAGLYFANENWFGKGWRIFKKEIQQQILPDGAHFERSPMYHSIILEDMLDLINIMNTYDICLPSGLSEQVYNMFYWLLGMLHPDDEIAFFNDAVKCSSVAIDKLWNYAKQLGINFPTKLPENTLIAFPHSGYYRMQLDDAVVILDAGEISPSYNPGHSHACSLSFEFSLDKERLFVNSGISTYEDTAERLQQRGTSAHNTVVVSEENSAEVWKSFRVGRRAKISDVILDTQQTKLQATHSGYAKLNVFHTRQWHLKTNQLLIMDELTGGARHDIKIYYHLHPEILVNMVDLKTVILKLQNKEVLMSFESDASLFVQIADTLYHPEFGLAVSNKTIICRTTDIVPFRVFTKIHWN